MLMALSKMTAEDDPSLTDDDNEWNLYEAAANCLEHIA